jgi:ADP-ribosylglycohydrolase
MIGAIIGDVIGSVHEHAGTKTTDFPLFVAGSRFTDDTVLTIATADALLTDGDHARAYREWGNRYPRAGYGGAFKGWLRNPGAGPYGSFGNGSAMRVSPVAFAFTSMEEVLAEAERSAAVTHNHPEGIKGAQATALAVYLAREGVSRAEIRAEVAGRFGYDLSRTIEEIRPSYRFDVTCQGSVPEALTAFFETEDLESAIRVAISLGGDADTQAAIAGGAAQAAGSAATPTMLRELQERLTTEMLDVLELFRGHFGLKN